MDDPATPQPASADELAAVYFRGRDVPCPNCGYNRRDGTGAKCPECAHNFDLRSLKYRIGVRPVVTLALCLLFSALLGLAASFVFVGEFISGSWNFGPWYEYTMIVLAILTAVLHALAIRLLFFVFSDSARAVRRMVSLVVVIAANLWLTAGGLLLAFYDRSL